MSCFSLIYRSLFKRSIGTFARALDCPTALKHPSLHMSAASASRDATLVRKNTREKRCFHMCFSFLLWIHYISIVMI